MLKGKERPVPGPTYMSDVQKADYLRSLRTPTVSRPSGSRPPPPSKFLRRAETSTLGERPELPTSNSMPNMPTQECSHTRTASNTSETVQNAGRPLVREPCSTEVDTPPIVETPTVQYKRSIPYMERGTRWMEKQEVRSLRMALEDMDEGEEKKLHAAAQDEASELVWKHQNPTAAAALAEAPYPNPDVRRDYHSHLRKGSYQRSHSQDLGSIVPERKVSGGSHEETNKTSLTDSKRRSMDVLRKVSPPAATVVVEKRRTPSGKSYGGLAEAVADDIARAHRRSSSGSRRILSGEKKKTFMHPNDQIWEDPQEEPNQQPQAAEPEISNIVVQPTHVRKNPFARVRMQAEKIERTRSEPIISAPMHHSVEIQKNPPSQSRRPWYMSNEPLSPTASSPGAEIGDEVPSKALPTKESRELRDDDIRAATSKRRSDYSPKLPRPTMVSDKPSRPIVSFQDVKPKEIVLEGIQAAPLYDAKTEPSKPRQPSGWTSTPPATSARFQTSVVPQVDVSERQKVPIPAIVTPEEPTIPSIVLPEEPDFAKPSRVNSAPAIPAINVEPPSISIQPPVINVSEAEMPFAQPWPTEARRPPPVHAATSPVPQSKVHYTPVPKQSGVLCARCALPIAGRILSAGGERFHPSCFVCHQCHTNLELVAFYAEPEKARAERLARIEARRSGAPIPINDLLQQEANDGDESLRFFCHLDFHELFSPRCKSCKTPIEGEVIVACGAEWHAGHFFCAQCGDPFDSTTPFVEKDGYAWCVNCHTNRYSSKCQKCKKPITETVVKALGYHWHEGCFVCTECSNQFGDGRYFMHGNNPVCVRCEQRRLKS